ncbi:MAG: hypothetical protein M3680_00050 [Myxococcota bacterium]|nr:hypothetical protein [Myxococcota bacterium]
MFEFLLFRSLWRWAIWVRVLGGLARIDLDPMHPDRRGGIAFLRLPSIGYCAMLLFTVASVLCAEWHDLAFFGVTLVSFAPLLVLFAAVGTLVAFGPLLLFRCVSTSLRQRLCDFSEQRPPSSEPRS